MFLTKHPNHTHPIFQNGAVKLSYPTWKIGNQSETEKKKWLIEIKSVDITHSYGGDVCFQFSGRLMLANTPA
jgi:hypothetical protein